MVIETNKLNPTTVVNSGTTQLEFKKNPVARSLTGASNVQRGMNSTPTLKPANEKAKEALHEKRAPQPQADSSAGKNMSVWTERTDLYQEFLDFGYNKGEIKVSEGPFNQLIESYPRKKCQ
ncbi:hypothetical protein GCM10007938_40200 [Vibrio zhanjiangensis]|uniref:Uncharacterized protein n=1 Tax=Vibrio zhanjiangensis TaxID=1046128 RepID=A0ABQ6F4P7_9VIBR|nr:hypothetical protein [Vibrio zhanjiangensis]GLT20237.1 hypothetical protein GCM10007938_40200 [Vibrio zhanjiangensis]